MDRRIACWVLLCGAMGCGGDPAGTDTGPSGMTDTGIVMVDTGVPIDIGPVPDTGPRPDTGPVPDTGVPVDTGMMSTDDTGVPVDGGPPLPDCMASIGPAGGEFACMGLTLSVPPAALARDTVLTARRLAPTEAPDVTDRATDGWEFGPDGLSFAVPARMTYVFTATERAALVGPMGTSFLNAVSRSEGEPDEFLAASLEIDGSSVTASTEVRHFSLLFLVRKLSLLPGDECVAYLETMAPPTPMEVGQRHTLTLEHDVSGRRCDTGLAIDRVSAFGCGPLVALGSNDPSRPGCVGRTLMTPGVNSTHGVYCRSQGRGQVIEAAHTTPVIGPMDQVASVAESFDVECVGPRKADAILLADFTRVTQSFGSLRAVSGPGAAANVIHATTAVTSRFSEADTDGTPYEGVDFVSDRGLDALTLRSSLQTVTATYAAGTSSYDVTGLAGAAAFAASDTLTVTGPGGTPSVAVPAPPPITVAQLFGAPDGLRTELRVPDGTFDALFVQVLASGSAMAGEAGMFRTVYPDEMTLRGTDRVTTILTAAQIAALAGDGLTADIVRVGVYRELATTDFFPTAPRVVPVQAGRIFEVAATDLIPQPSPCDSRPTGTTCTAGPNYRIVVAHEFGVEAFDPTTGALIGDVIPRPASMFIPRSFHGVTQGPDNCLWVTDRQTTAPGVYRYRPDGTAMDATPYLGPTAVPSFAPLFIHEVGTEIWASSSGRIEAFRTDGTHARTVVDGMAAGAPVGDFLRLTGGDIVAASGNRLARFPVGGGAPTFIRSDRNTIDQITIDAMNRLVITEAGTSRRAVIEVGLDGTLGRQHTYTTPVNTRGVAVLADGRWLVTGRSLMVAVVDPATSTSTTILPGAAIYRYAGFACLP